MIGLYDDVFNGSLSDLITGRTIEWRQLAGKSLLIEIWLNNFKTAFTDHLGSFCNISYDILSVVSFLDHLRFGGLVMCGVETG